MMSLLIDQNEIEQTNNGTAVGKEFGNGFSAAQSSIELIFYC
jgi:hypothetical protein